MAGTDTGAHSWAEKYDPLATNLIDAATSVVLGAGQCYDLLYATGVNHLNADGQSAISNEAVLQMPPIGVRTYAKPSIASAEGGHGDVPEWWHTIAAYVEGELWPNGHQDKLRTAAEAWTTASKALRTAAQLVNGGTSSMGAIAPLMDQRSPEFPNLIKNCTMERDQMDAVADSCDDASKVCADYAQTIDDAHSKIIHEMVVLGTTIAVTELVAAVLIPFTAGASEAVSKVVDVARLTATGSKIATIIRDFRLAAELSAMPAVSAAGAAARSLSEMAPLLQARPVIFAAENAGRAGRVAEGTEAANLSQASVRDKLERYLLNPDHEIGGPKAAWFERALGFTRENAPDLAKQIVFDESRAVETGVTQFGTKYNEVIPVTGANGKTIDVTFAWIRNNDGVVRLVTAIPTGR
ncbi:WXG100-like domain-containing protein [Mycobacterium sp. BMJ-28]